MHTALRIRLVVDDDALLGYGEPSTTSSDRTLAIGGMSVVAS